MNGVSGASERLHLVGASALKDEFPKRSPHLRIPKNRVPETPPDLPLDSDLGRSSRLRDEPADKLPAQQWRRLDRRVYVLSFATFTSTLAFRYAPFISENTKGRKR